MGFGDRRWTQSDARFWLRPPLADDAEAVARGLRDELVGERCPIASPYGQRRLVYCDWSASGRALRFVERFITDRVLPLYGNTHTSASRAGLSSSWCREEARAIIQSACNGSAVDDVVLFTGSGTTAAVHKLIHALQLDRFVGARPVVFVGLQEHHSNLLPWRECPHVEMRTVPADESGGLDLSALERLLVECKDRPLLMGSFTAASNVTGALCDVHKVTALLKAHRALAFWDYGSGFPGLGCDMNPVDPQYSAESIAKDAVFISPHKMAGGPGTPGVLVAKRALWANPVPSGHGGGSVFFVTAEEHRYLWQLEEREEGGTPDIVGAIRAGLAMHVHRTVGAAAIERLERAVACSAMEQLVGCEPLQLLGDTSTARLPVFSFVVLHRKSGRYLHHNLVATLLNDLFGIQARAGCACAGPYAQWLLGIDLTLARELERSVLDERGGLAELLTDQARRGSGRELLRPGFVRVSLHYTASTQLIQFVCSAIKMVARDGWRVMADYQMDPETGEWSHRNFKSASSRLWLSDVALEADNNDRLRFSAPELPEQAASASEEEYYAETLSQAAALGASKQRTGEQSVLDPARERLRWFLYPTEAVEYLRGGGEGCAREPLFRVRGCAAPAAAPPVPEPVVVEREWGFVKPPKPVFGATVKAIEKFKMIEDGDRVMIGVSGGKDSLSMVHILRSYQQMMKHRGVNFSLGAVTVDPKADGFDPRPLRAYFEALGMDYFFEEQPIIDLARSQQQPPSSICSFCARMKRGRLYAAMRREGYNVLALGQHLDDAAESFLMAAFFNGVLRTIKANYAVAQEDLRVIRPLTFVRERDLRAFAAEANLPVINENCPACFEAPKERVRCKQLLAAQEHQTPQLFNNLKAALMPMLSIDNAKPDHQDMSANGAPPESKKGKPKTGPKLGERWTGSNALPASKAATMKLGLQDNAVASKTGLGAAIARLLKQLSSHRGSVAAMMACALVGIAMLRLRRLMK